jgi:hypothetical protein
MSDFNKNIDRLVSRILNEEIESKVKELSKTINEGEWTEIEMEEELYGGQKKLDVAEPKGKLTSDDFKKLRDAKSHKKEVEEYFYNEAEDEEIEDIGEEECNECGDEMYESKDDKKWIQKTQMHKGDLHKKLDIPEGDKIPKSKLQSLKKELMKKGEGDKKLSAADSKLLKQVNLALTLKSVKESTKSLRLTEEELIDMIETLVNEQKVKDIDEKNNIANKEPEGLKKTNKVLDLNKKENDDYAKEVVKKMRDYVKAGSKGEYTENPDDFPKSNYQMDKDAKIKKYNPSEAVDEYIDAFSYPGMTNLVYDEIKPEDEKIDKYLNGDSTTGNAITDKEGKALGNVSKGSIEVGKKFKKNYDENLYGAEQMQASYQKSPQPIEVAGDTKLSGSLSSKKSGKKGGKSSLDKAQGILNQLESAEDKKANIISEEMNKMKNLISYDRKTQ